MIALALKLSGRDSPKVRQALLAAMAVESNFRNVNYGDRDSLGVLQQRPSQGWGPPGNPAQDIQQFLARARAAKNFQGTPGQLAQSVQRSAFPERYDQRMKQVMELLGGGAGAPASPIPPAPHLGSERGGNVARLTALRGAMDQGPLAMLRAMQAAGARNPPGAPVSPPKTMGALAGSTLPSATGFNPQFATALQQLIKASGGQVRINSGFRSVAEQQKLWNAALKKYGSAAAARKWVAPPGRSNHNKGIAADLAGNLALAAKLAPRFGLYRPMAHEPWHFEPRGSRG